MGTTIVIIIAAAIVVSVFAMLISLSLTVAKAAKRDRADRRERAQTSLVWADVMVVEVQSHRRKMPRAYAYR